MAEIDRSLILAFLFLYVFVVAMGAGVSRGTQKVLFMLLVLTSMTHIADVQFGYDEDAGRLRGTVWGFRFTFNDLMALPLFGGLVVASLIGRRRFRWFPPGSVAIWLLFASGVLSLAAAEAPVYGLFELNNVLLGYVVFAATANFVRTTADLRFAVVLLVLCAAIPALVGVTQHYQYLWGERYISRVTGTTIHPNLLSMYLNGVLPLCLVLALTTRRWLLRLVLFGVCILGSAAVMFTVSRGGVAALVFGYGVACALWLLFSRSAYKLPKLALLLLLLVPVGIKWSPLLVERMESKNAKASSRGRQALTDRSMEIWRTSPIIGVGINNYARLEHTANVHNTYVLYLTEVGVVGLIALIVLLASFGLRALGNVWRAPPGSLLRVANIGLTAGLAAVYLQLYAEFAIRSENIHYLFFIFGGLVAASAALIREERRAAVPGPAHVRRRARAAVGA